MIQKALPCWQFDPQRTDGKVLKLLGRSVERMIEPIFHSSSWVESSENRGFWISQCSMPPQKTQTTLYYLYLVVDPSEKNMRQLGQHPRSLIFEGLKFQHLPNQPADFVGWDSHQPHLDATGKSPHLRLHRGLTAATAMTSWRFDKQTDKKNDQTTNYYTTNK